MRLRIITFLGIFLLSGYGICNSTNAYLLTLGKHFVKNNIPKSIKNYNVTIKPIANHIKLQRCHNPVISMQYPATMLKKQLLSISCGKPYWHVYLQMQVSAIVPVVVAKKMILPHTLLNSDNLMTQQVNTSQLQHGYFSSLNHFPKSKTNTYIKQGAIITPRMLQKQFDVLARQNIKIISNADHVSVMMKGVALQSGMVGDRIKVKNIKTKKVLEGSIIDNNDVLVN